VLAPLLTSNPPALGMQGDTVVVEGPIGARGSKGEPVRDVPILLVTLSVIPLVLMGRGSPVHPPPQGPACPAPGPRQLPARRVWSCSPSPQWHRTAPPTPLPARRAGGASCCQGTLLRRAHCPLSFSHPTDPCVPAPGELSSPSQRASKHPPHPLTPLCVSSFAGRAWSEGHGRRQGGQGGARHAWREGMGLGGCAGLGGAGLGTTEGCRWGDGPGRGGIPVPHVLVLVGTLARCLAPQQGELPEPASEGHHGQAVAVPQVSFLPCVDLGFCLQGARGEQGEKGSTGFPGARGPGGQKVRSWAPPAARRCWGVRGGAGGTVPLGCPNQCLHLPRERSERWERPASR